MFFVLGGGRFKAGGKHPGAQWERSTVLTSCWYPYSMAGRRASRAGQEFSDREMTTMEAKEEAGDSGEEKDDYKALAHENI